MGAGQGGVQVGCPVCDLMDQQATSSSHRTRPSLPPSVHSGRPSLTTPGPFGGRCSFIPSLLPCLPPSLPLLSLPRSSFPWVSVLAVSWPPRSSPVAGQVDDTLTLGDVLPAGVPFAPP